MTEYATQSAGKSIGFNPLNKQSGWHARRGIRSEKEAWEGGFNH